MKSPVAITLLSRIVRVIPILAVFLFLALEGCSDSSSPEQATGTMSEEFIRAVVVRFKGSGESSRAFSPTPITAPPQAFRIPGALRSLRNRVAMRFGASPVDSCGPQYSGDQSDADKDGIWKDASISIDCTSGADRVKGELKINDENDSLALPKAGFTAELSQSLLSLGMSGGKRLDVTIDPSQLQVQISGTASARLLASAAISSDGWNVSTGIDVNGAFTGDISEPKEGDKLTASGFYRLKTEKVTDIPDAEFKAKLDVDFTMGICSGASRVQFQTGTARLTDGAGNVLQLSVKDCTATATYNAKTLE